MLIFCLLLIAGTVCAFACYREIFYSPRKKQDGVFKIPSSEQYQSRRVQIRTMIETLAALPYESVSISSRDGLRLAGRYYHVRDGAPLGICVHGYRSVSVRDFCGGSDFLLKHGYNILLVDQRAHGESEGRTIAFGLLERFDCFDWVQWALARFGAQTKIVLYGVSMGATTVLMSSGLALPRNVCGIVADCPYSSPGAIIRKVCRDMHLPAWLLDPFVRLGALLFGHFRLSADSAARAVRRAQIPILLIHGEEDRFVPCEMSEEISAANPAIIRRETFPGAGHALSFLTDQPRYEKILEEFLDQCLSCY